LHSRRQEIIGGGQRRGSHNSLHDRFGPELLWILEYHESVAVFLADEEVLGVRSDTGPNTAEQIESRVLKTVRPNLDILLVNIDGKATLRVKLTGLGQTS
jgi:hypothetical protein